MFVRRRQRLDHVGALRAALPQGALAGLELVPLELKPLEAGAVVTDASPPPARTLSLDSSGGMYLDREPITLEAVVPTLQAALEDDPETVLYLAVADEVGPTDRIPVLLELWNQLRIAEIPIRMVGRPAEASKRSPLDS